jgi:hypothetical protein
MRAPALTPHRDSAKRPVAMDQHAHAAEAAPPAHHRMPLLDAYLRHRFTALFVTLLVTLAAGSTLETVIPRANPLEWLLVLNLLAAVASMAHEGRMRLPILLGAAFLVTRVLLAALGVPGMLTAGEVVWVTAVALAMGAAIRHAFSRGMVDRERILAALDAFLLAGLLFGVVYWMLDRAWPDSFGERGGAAFSLPNAIYFSFVTIATLGYGDVVPASAPARGLAIVEGVSGQMYMTVLVARLVSLYAKQRED